MYPLKFEPILKQTLWGGDKILPFKHLSDNLTGVGESWEISGVEDNESVVANGPDKGFTLTDMVRKYREELVGEENYARFGNKFPLLIKFIDAKQDLSIQISIFWIFFYHFIYWQNHDFIFYKIIGYFCY